MKWELNCEPGPPDDDRQPPLRSLFWCGVAALLIVIAACSTGCTSIFYGADGKPAARIMGDYTYHRTAAGAVTITLKHSPVIRAGGVATSQALATAGTAASAIILATP